jgi:hypothetical protein
MLRQGNSIEGNLFTVKRAIGLGLLPRGEGKHQRHRCGHRNQYQHCCRHFAFPPQNERGGLQKVQASVPSIEEARLSTALVLPRLG